MANRLKQDWAPGKQLVVYQLAAEVLDIGELLAPEHRQNDAMRALAHELSMDISFRGREPPAHFGCRGVTRTFARTRQPRDLSTGTPLEPK